MGTEIVTQQQKFNNLNGFLERMAPQLERQMSKHLTADRLIRLTLTASNKNSKLFDCTQQSIAMSLLTASQIGLEPNGRDAHLVPYGTECQFIPDYKGLAKLAHRSGLVRRIDANVVYEKDHFRYRLGTGQYLEHIPSTEEDRGKFLFAWSLVELVTGGEMFVVLSAKEIDKIQAMSKASYADAPWKKWPDEMRKKTAFKRLSKLCPLGDDFEAAVEHDNMIEMSGQMMRPQAQAVAALTGNGNRKAIDTTAEMPTDPEPADEITPEHAALFDECKEMLGEYSDKERDDLFKTYKITNFDTATLPQLKQLRGFLVKNAKKE